MITITIPYTQKINPIIKTQHIFPVNLNWWEKDLKPSTKIQKQFHKKHLMELILGALSLPK